MRVGANLGRMTLKASLRKSESCSIMSDSLQLYSPWNSPGQNTRVGSLSILQGIFPTQRWIPGLLHCSRILYQLIHKGSPRILELVVYPFFRGSSWHRNWTRVSCIEGGFFIDWAMREAQESCRLKCKFSGVEYVACNADISRRFRIMRNRFTIGD